MGTAQGYHLRKSGERVNELLSRQFIVPTLNEIPSENTLTWQDGDYIVDFRIGELVRVMIENKYTFYRLEDITMNKASWIEATSADLDDYYTKKQIDDKISQIIITGGGGGVEITTPEQYESKKENNEIIDNMIYLLIVDDAPFEMYIGLHLIGKKGDTGDLGFPYSFPITF